MAIPVTLWGTEARYTTWLGSVEVVEASNPDDATAGTVDSNRVAIALELAKQQLVAADNVACPPGKALIRSQLEYLQYLLTRHLLDTLKTREDVKEGFEHVQKVLEQSRSDEVCDGELDGELATELGLDIPPNQRMSSLGRKWSADTLAKYRRGRWIGTT